MFLFVIEFCLLSRQFLKPSIIGKRVLGVLGRHLCALVISVLQGDRACDQVCMEISPRLLECVSEGDQGCPTRW